MTNHVIDHEISLNFNTPEIFENHETPWETFLKHHSPLNEVPGLVAIPSLENIRQAFCLHRLSVTLQRKIIDCDVMTKKSQMKKAAEQGGGDGEPRFPRESRLPMPGKRLIRKAIIRSFIAGATLAEYYTQPLDRCHAYYNYLRATRWMNDGNGIGRETDDDAAAEAFHGVHPPQIMESNGFITLVDFANVMMALIGFDHYTTKLDPCHADFLRLHAVYCTDIPETTLVNSVSEMVKQSNIFCRLEQWLMYTILSDTAARARYAARFRLGVGRGTLCPGVDKCALSLMHIPLANTHPSASSANPATYSHADAHFIV